MPEPRDSAMAIAREIALAYSTLLPTNGVNYRSVSYKFPPKLAVQILDGMVEKKVMSAVGEAGVRFKIETSPKAQYYIGKAFSAPTKLRYGPPPISDLIGQTILFGRCYCCAALAAYQLLNNEEFKALRLSVEIAGTRGVDHKFVIVGRRNLDVANLSKGVNDPTKWGPNAFILDIWDANMVADEPLKGRETDDELGVPAVVLPGDWRYIGDCDTDKLLVQARYTEHCVGDFDYNDHFNVGGGD